MVDGQPVPEGIEISPSDMEKTPPGVLKFLLYLHEENQRLKKHIEELEARLNQDSSNSNRPPSSDCTFKKKSSGKDEKKGKARSRKGHKGHRQQMLDPTETREVRPKRCSCGCDRFFGLERYYTHQHIEFPEIIMKVIHFILYKGKCCACGKVSKGHVPAEFQTGYGPRLSALVAEFAGITG